SWGYEWCSRCGGCENRCGRLNLPSEASLQVEQGEACPSIRPALATWWTQRVDAPLPTLRSSLRPDRHALRKPRCPQRLGQARELAEQRARLPGIDDLFHPEFFGGAGRRAQPVEAGPADPLLCLPG